MADMRDQLYDLADRVGRLSQSRRDPERFFEERDEIRRELERIASDAGRDSHP